MLKIKNILVVDDDTDIGQMIKLILSHKGYEVTVLESTEQLEETIKKNNIELLFLDMLLSGINGVDICSGIKKNKSFAHIPVIMMSAHSDAQKICLQAGADDFIIKPFNIQDIFLKINNLNS